MSGKSENISIRLPPDIREQVDRLAKANRRSRNFIINEAVGRYVAETTPTILPPAKKEKNPQLRLFIPNTSPMLL